MTDKQKNDYEPKVPYGWRLVPEEPTMKMCMEAFNCAIKCDCDCDFTYAVTSEAAEIYKTMLNAAPTLPNIMNSKEELSRKPMEDNEIYEIWNSKFRSWIGGEQFEHIVKFIEKHHNIG